MEIERDEDDELLEEDVESVSDLEEELGLEDDIKINAKDIILTPFNLAVDRFPS